MSQNITSIALQSVIFPIGKAEPLDLKFWGQQKYVEGKGVGLYHIHLGKGLIVVGLCELLHPFTSSVLTQRKHLSGSAL